MGWTNLVNVHSYSAWDGPIKLMYRVIQHGMDQLSYCIE